MLVTVWSGLALGAVYALVAFGLTISMLASGIFNFAQGAVVVAGTYLTSSLLGGDGLGLPALLLLNGLGGAALGMVCEIACVRPLRRRPADAGQHGELVTTVGFSTALVGAIGLHWGYLPRTVPFAGPDAPVRFLGIVAQPAEIVVLAGACAAALALHLWFQRTRHGQACLAVAEDREAATLRGIDVDRLSLAGFAAAGAFGTLSAIAIGPITFALPSLATILALGGFVAIALGGHGNFLGCLLGGLLVGVASALATRYLGAAYGDLAVLAVLLGTLAVRPTGLGAPAAARRV